MKRLLIFGLLLFSVNFYSQGFEKGILSNETKTRLIEELSKLSSTTIDNTSTMVLNFYLIPEAEPNGSCIDHYTSDDAYKRFMKRKGIVHFFITEKGYYYAKATTLKDKNGEIKKLLFENAEPCGNYIIIKPNGEYIKRYGEYRQEEIPKLIKQKE